MVDLFTLALTHGLIALALWRMLFRPELDLEQSEPVRRPWRRPDLDASDEDAPE